jgi:peptide deformylase
MTVHPIRELGDPILRQPASPFDDPCGADVARIMADLHETLNEYRARTGYGRAMSAPQIGVLKRALIIDYADYSIELANPRFERWSRDEEQRYESCFSFPGLWGLVQRPVSVVLVGWTPAGEERRIEASGTLARILQHEMDHLDGLVWLDRDPDMHSLCTTAEYEKRYTSR